MSSSATPGGQRLEQSDRVLHDVAPAGFVAVDQPLGELELGVQAGTLARPRVGGATARRDICGVDVVGGSGSRREPLQIGRGVAHREPVPLEKARHLRHAVDIVEEEGCRTGAPEDDGRLEAPELVRGDRATPALEQRFRSAARSLGAVDDPAGIGADLLRRADRQTLGADDRQGERVQSGQRRAQRGRGAATRRQVRRIDAVPGQEVDDHGARVADAGFAEEFGCAEGQQSTNARGQCPERPHLGGQFRRCRVVDGNPHDHTPPVVELGDRGVVAPGRSLGQHADSDDAGPRQSRRDGRG